MRISFEILRWVSRSNFSTLNFYACLREYLQARMDHFLHDKSIFWGTSMDQNLSQIKLLLNFMTKDSYMLLLYILVWYNLEIIWNKINYTKWETFSCLQVIRWQYTKEVYMDSLYIEFIIKYFHLLSKFQKYD